MPSPQDVEARIAADPALAQLRARVAPRLSDDPGHDLQHCLRVAAWTLRLGGASVDPREAIAAALLHDVVNPPKNDPGRATASERSAELGREWLTDLHFERDAIDRICDAIRDHSHSRGVVPEAPLGRALQDADRLEALGAIGLMRCVATGARLQGHFFHSVDLWAKARPLDDHRYSVDHFFTKLLHLSGTMCTEAGRLEAQRRTAFLEQFLAQLETELGVKR
ncbi:MAG: HD domain-containing protein [Polyangiaceae bacterium]